MADNTTIDELERGCIGISCELCRGMHIESASVDANHRDAPDADRGLACLCGFVISHAVSLAPRP
jgi:hypothetical protein